MTVSLTEFYAAKVEPADKAVIDYWLLNPGDAAHRAVIQGYPDANPRGSKARLNRIKKKDEVALYLDANQKEKSIEHSITFGSLIQELSAVAFGNLMDVLEPADGPGGALVLKDLNDLTEQQKRSIKKIKYTEHGIEIQLYDKMKATTELIRVLGLANKENQEESEGLRFIKQIGVLVLPANQTYEEAVAGYIQYEGQVIEAEK